MTEKKKTGLELLREPFLPHQISKLPKPTKKQTDDVRADFKKGVRCEVCGTWHHPDVIHLDYVGHAALTDRLLDCDPAWNWEPVAMSEDGAPKFDREGGMWIRLTVCGTTRLGYGHPDGKTGGNAIKETIGDALRNSAMRFGAALDLWHKGELHVAEDEGKDDKAKTLDTGGGMKEAWADGVKDRLPANATPQQTAQAYADQIAEDMRKAKTPKGTTAAWDKRADIIDRIAEKFPTIHWNLLDQYQAEMNSYEDDDDDEKI